MGTNRRILVADDDPLIRKSLSDLLSKNGCQLTVVQDGNEAWAVLQKPDPPSVVLLDWNMPGLTGLEVMDRLLAVPNLSHVYVIFLTVRDKAGDIIMSLDRGAHDFVAKPFEAEELLARIRVAFRTVDLQRQLTERVEELEEAFKRINQLEGILPICCMCKKIKNPESHWSTVEQYVEAHAPVRFSHGYCPECYREVLDQMGNTKDLA